uniref:Uncharacterized protein n=1 Tax=Lactuca sativa TaxID=4236 RepID=A0A9R1VPG3_LACSA|nr:hypothetical protein LSAT_V11C400161920 [Lactuca sativa]
MGFYFEGDTNSSLREIRVGAFKMEGVLDFDTIDVELDEDFLKKQSRRCRDEFLNSLSLDDVDEDFIIPLFENVEDDEADGF